MGIFKRKKTSVLDKNKGEDKKEEKIAVDKPAKIKKAEKSVKPAATSPARAEEKAGRKAKTEKKAVESKKKSMKDLYGGGQAKTLVKDDKKEFKTRQKTPERIFGNAYKIIIKPLITEKAANLGSENKYVFAVNLKSNKIEIAKAINEVYGVMPVQVNVISVKGKKVTYGRIIGQRKNWKKAIVTLPKGKTIKVYEGV